MALEYPDVFGKAGVFSPSLWFSPKIFEMMQKYKLKKMQKFYLLAGAKEGGSTVPDLEKAMELLVKAGFDDQYYIRMRIDPNGRHNESFWAREFGNAVQYLFNF
jgi:alpha-glucosidase